MTHIYFFTEALVWLLFIPLGWNYVGRICNRSPEHRSQHSLDESILNEATGRQNNDKCLVKVQLILRPMELELRSGLLSTSKGWK